MPRDSFGKYYSITGARFSHDMKFIVVATSHAWLQVRVHQPADTCLRELAGGLCYRRGVVVGIVCYHTQSASVR